MPMIRKVVPAQINALGDDEVEIVMSTAQLARDGHILVPQGCILENYRQNPIILWQHDPEHPVANAESIQIDADKITARVRFAPLGVSAKADEVRGLVKSGVVRAVSVGFDPLEGDPIDPAKPRGGKRFTKWELLESSFCSVPVDTSALVTARALDNETQERRMPAKKTRTKQRAATPTFTRGLYEIASLAYMLESLGYAVDHAKWEAALEGDNSQVPAMLGEALMSLGEALVAMTQEEVAELLDGRTPEEETETTVTVTVEERAHIAEGKTERARAWRRGVVLAKYRAGKMLSEDTVRCLRDAMEAHDEAMGHHRSAMRACKRGIGVVQDLIDRAEGAAGANSEVQKSGGTAEDEGSRSVDFRRRQADLKAFAPAT